MQTLISRLKTLSIFFFLVFFSFNTIGQIVIVSKYPKKVPAGKKWVLTQQMSTIVEVDKHTLESGSYFNALIRSNPRVIGIIGEGEYGRPNNLYQIEFRGLTKVTYANNLTYKLSGIIDFKVTSFPGSQTSTQSSLTFYPGQTVSVNDGLESLQLMQLPFTASEIAEIRRNEKIQENNDHKEIAQLRAKRSAEIINDYKEANEEIINGLKPLSLNQIDINPNKVDITPGVEDNNLPHKLLFNKEEIKYNIDIKKFLKLLDSMLVYNSFFIQFDKFGKFKSLFNGNHKLVNVPNNLVDAFKSAISLATPVTLNYNHTKYPIELETNEFSVKKTEGSKTKQFAFIATKTSIEFLDIDKVDKELLRAAKSILDTDIALISMPITLKNIMYLKKLLVQELTNNSSSQDYSHRRLTLHPRTYKDEFKIKNGDIVFNYLNTTYVVNTIAKTLSLTLHKKTDFNDVEVGTIEEEAVWSDEHISNVIFYNKNRRAFEELYH